MLFSEYVEQWKKDTLALKARATRDVWGSAIKRELLPRFGKMEISAIGNPDVKAFVAGLSARFAPKTTSGLQPQSPVGEPLAARSPRRALTVTTDL